MQSMVEQSNDFSAWMIFKKTWLSRNFHMLMLNIYLYHDSKSFLYINSTAVLHRCHFYFLRSGSFYDNQDQRLNNRADICKNNSRIKKLRHSYYEYFASIRIIYYYKKYLFRRYYIVIPFDDFDISRNDSVFDVDIISQLEHYFLNAIKSNISSLFMELFFSVLWQIVIVMLMTALCLNMSMTVLHTRHLKRLII